MRIRFILFSVSVLFILAFQTLTAQTMTGAVLNSVSQKPVAGVRVFARAFRDTTRKYETRTDSAGKFSLETGKGMFGVLISKDGYISAFRMGRMFAGDTNFGLILITDTATRLKEAVVTAKIPAAQQKGDTSEYNAGAYKTNPDATAEDLLKKMPGMSVQNGQVTAHGEQVKKVTVDGKDWFGDDASAVLRNLPAEVVDKMQVFDRGSDQANFSRVDDGTSSKSINIVTKRGLSNGKFGKAYAGYGTDNRYNAGLNYNTFKGERRFTVLGMLNNINQQNFTSQDLLGLSTGSGGGGRMGMGGMGGGGGSYGGSYGGGNYGGMGGNSGFNVNQSNGINTTRSFGLNYTDKWNKHFSINASYFLNSGTNEKTSDIHRSYINSFNPENQQTYKENSVNTNNSLNHRFNLRLTWTLDTNNIILYTPRLTYQQTSLDQNFHAGYSTPLLTLNNSSTIFTNNGSGLNLNNTLLYMHRFKKYGRTFAISGSHEINTKESESKNDNRNYTYVPSDSAFFTNQQIKNNAPSTKINSRVTYTEPISKKSTIQVEYTYNLNQNESNKKTYNYDSSYATYSKLDSSLSNIFKSTWFTHQAGLMYNYRDDKLWMGIGGNMQYYELNGTREMPAGNPVKFNMTNFLPRFMMSYKISKTANLRSFARVSTNAPGVNQLQSVIDNSNPLLLTTGNANLQQEVSRFGVIRFSKVNVEKSRNFFIGMMGTSTKNYITNNTTFLLKDSQFSEGFTAFRGSQITRPENIQGYYTTRLFGNYGFPVARIKSNLNINSAYNFSHTPGLVNGNKNIASTQNVTLGAVVSSNVSEYLDFTLSYSGNYFNTKNSFQTSLNNEYFNHSANVKFNYIFRKKFVVNTDWTWTNYSGLSSGFNQTFMLWNAGLAYKFMKKNAAELRLSVFDMLKQNNSISRTITETYVEDNITKVLQRYFMLTFTYNLRKLNGEMPKQQGPPSGMPPGMMGPPPGH